MSSDEQKSNQTGSWSIEQWQCGIGVVDSCKGKTLLWDEPESWRSLVDEVIPMTEILIVFGVQYVSSQIGPGTTKAINSLRCMINNLGSNSWSLMAGAWQLLLYAGQSESLKPTIDSGYEYVCTCLWDANGIKEMLGASAESNAQFSSCSEAAANSTVRANNKKANDDQAKRDAAKQSIVDAAMNKMINDTVTEMKEINSCGLKTSAHIEPNGSLCMAATTVMRNDIDMAVKYWGAQVIATGGAESTKNKDEQTQFKEAGWTQKGVIKGLFQLFPDRYDEEGNPVATCVSSGDSPVTSYGDACTAVIDTYKAALGTPMPLCKGAECDTTIECFTGNNNANPKLEGKLLCDLVPIGNGFSQWQDASLISCQDPATITPYTRIANCQSVAGVWQYRGAYTNPDQQRFRTLGFEVPKDLANEDIKCLANDMTSVRIGKENCFEHWVTGQNVGLIDQYVWLTQENVTCGLLKGTENCKLKKETECNSSKVVRLALGGKDICIPTMTWEAKA